MNYNPLNKIIIQVYTYITKQMREKRKFSPTAVFQLINVEGRWK